MLIVVLAVNTNGGNYIKCNNDVQEGGRMGVSKINEQL